MFHPQRYRYTEHARLKDNDVSLWSDNMWELIDSPPSPPASPTPFNLPEPPPEEVEEEEDPNYDIAWLWMEDQDGEEVPQPPTQDGMENDDTGDCKICMDNPANGVLVPCGHMAFCIGCIEKLTRRTCPICNQPFVSFVKVYRS